MASCSRARSARRSGRRMQHETARLPLRAHRVAFVMYGGEAVRPDDGSREAVRRPLQRAAGSHRRSHRCGVALESPRCLAERCAWTDAIDARHGTPLRRIPSVRSGAKHRCRHTLRHRAHARVPWRPSPGRSRIQRRRCLGGAKATEISQLRRCRLRDIVRQHYLQRRSPAATLPGGQR